MAIIEDATIDPAAQSGPPPAGPRPSQHDRAIDEVLFKRELDEVYLLMDFVSGRPDKELSSLSVPDPRQSSDPSQPAKNLTPQQVVARLALVRYPPNKTWEQNADDAALLMLAKDCLTGLASPARGITIAYTVLFTGTSWLDSLTRGFRPAKPVAGPSSEAQPRFFMLSESAFPGLSAEVSQFVRALGFLLIVAVLWLMWTAFAYWDVALGRSIVQRIDQIHSDRLALFQANPDYAGPVKTGPKSGEFVFSPPPVCPTPDAPASGVAGAQAGQPAAEHLLSCWKLRDLAKAEDEATNDLLAFRRGGSSPWVHVLHVVRWAFVLCGVDQKTMTTQQSVATVLSVFSNYVLPMMFGVLGTFMMAIRTIQWKIRESTLSPRDLWNTVLAFPLGIVAGVAVGLFYSPSTAPTVAGGGGLAANLSLTTCGLGFLAGYGSQPFFTSLDSLLTTVFSVTGDSQKTKPADRTGGQSA
jgi:hypothetical protein